MKTNPSKVPCGLLLKLSPDPGYLEGNCEIGNDERIENQHHSLGLKHKNNLLITLLCGNVSQLSEVKLTVRVAPQQTS
jgi:hypothetical protein